MTFQLISKKITALFFMVLLVAGAAVAGGQDDEKVDKTTLKTREAVSKASPDDWFTLAKSAEKCIKKQVNLKEAAKWLDQSLEIKETSYNLSVKGDYYYANKLPDKALEYYVKSLQVGKKQDVNFDGRQVQQKIADLYLNN
ncbi:MAG: hypothetical protein ACNS62_00315 [Candidatus Cyclobacteriaceae bacterium M3_2C_046]